MTKHPKYIFTDLPKSSVVNPNETFDITNQDDEIIAQAVTDHLQTIVHGENSSENANIKIKDEEEVIVDLEKLKLESYSQGHEEAKVKYENIISDINIDKELSILLRTKLEEIKQEGDIDHSYVQLCTDILSNIIKNLCFILPVDFEKVIKEKLLDNLKKFYKSGSIILTINPERSSFCKNLLETDELSAKLKEKFEIIEDNSLGKNDCKLQWQETTVKYDQEQLNAEIESIIQQLKTLVK